MRKPPVIGITLGDPGGIGPEVTIKSLAKGIRGARFVLFGSHKALLRHASAAQVRSVLRRVELIEVGPDTRKVFGPNPERGGRASIAYLEAAFAFYKAGKIDGLVTGPIHKASWHRLGYRYPGQTEYCAEQTGASDFLMLMAGRRFRIGVLTTHISLRDAIEGVTAAAIVQKVRLLDREFRRLGWKRPRIGCAALNPHAGEEGAFGDEELRIVVPAIAELRAQGIDVQGPIAPEVIFRVAARERKWDVILALYHDQAMIPLKLLDFDHSANVTLGLPLIRTSPDHGTAFDIAGKGKANPASMTYAIRLAIDWTRKRMHAGK